MRPIDNRRNDALHRTRLCVATALLLATAGAVAATPATGTPADSTPTVIVEVLPGTTVKRVTLSAKAAERLDIQVGSVTEDVVVRRQMVSGLVVAPPAGAPVAGDLWVRVMLSPAEWERLAREQPARLLPLATRSRPGNETWATPAAGPPRADAKNSMLTLHYVVRGRDSGLAPNERIRVELPLAGSADRQKVVPYSAIHYDAKGAAWVYVNARPLTFERQRVTVERVAGELAVLSAGPPAGTAVVTVGAPLLYGAEIFGK